MVNNFNYINIREVLSRLLRHPLLQELNLEAAIQYTLDFIGIMGLPEVYADKMTEAPVEIREYRGELPCDLVSINQVRDHKTRQFYTSMTDNFNGRHCHMDHSSSNPTYKTQGRVIFTSVKETSLDISYRGILVDEEGLPLIPDNPVFLKALELYIKVEWFTILFDQGKIGPAVLQNAQQQYAFRAGQCNSEFRVPSVSEMEALTNMLNQMIPRVNEFNHGFRRLGSKEYLKIQ